MEPEATTVKSNAIVRFAVFRRVTMTMIIVGLIVLGWISMKRLPLEYLPAFSSNNVSVNVSYPSSSPIEIERSIVRPLEESLSTINGVEELGSSARGSSGNVNVTFKDGVDMNWAAVEVRDRIERVRHRLPDDVERVNVRRFQSGDIPIMRFHLSSNWPRENLFRFAEDVLQRRLERLSGVAAVDIGGLRTPELQVNLDPGRLRAHGMDSRDIRTALGANNLNLSAGDIQVGTRRLLVRAVGEFHAPGEVAKLPLNSTGLRLEDVADVNYTYPQQYDYNFLNGVEALTVAINKDSTSNILAVVDDVRRELKAIEAMPSAEGLEVRIFSDASEDVRKGLSQLRDTGLIGGSLAIFAVFLFLRRFRTTLLIAMAIPVSVVSTFVLLYFLRQGGISDVTLNVISLAGMMLALGMLVDNSVVVIESIFRHRNELGRNARDAALAGTTEVALPITASTITTMCVFLPLIFLGGEGRFALYFENVAIMICIVIVSSLLIALTFVPMAAALILRNQAPKQERTQWLAKVYGWILGFSLRYRFALVLALAALVYPTWNTLTSIERSFSSRSLDREVTINVDTPRQYSFEQTSALYKEVYDLIDAHRDEFDIKDITYGYDRGTGRSRGGWSRSRRMNIHLKDEEESKLTTIQAREGIRELLPVKPGVNLRIASTQSRGGSGGIQVELIGEDATVLELISRTVAERLATIESIRDIDTSLESGDEEIWVQVQDSQVLQAGLSGQAIAQTVNSALSSRALSQFKTADKEIDLVMQYAEEERETLGQLKNVPVFAAGTAVPLGAIADFSYVSGPRSISRTNNQLKVSVEANTADPKASFRAMGSVGEVMRSIALPAGYSWSFGRWNRYQQKDQNTGLIALMMALPLVYMVLAALFESFAQPLTIMLSVPFAMIGVTWAMSSTNQPWDQMAMIGVIVLVGVVVNNAIVLIDHINHLRAEGVPRDEAILRGGKNRLRPILITAITTILGMLPMVSPILFPQWFGPLEGRASTWAPIGLVIVGGLTTSTFLTLVVIPTFYSLIDDASMFVRRVVRSA